ncbi:hypothetical protein BT63DRAFT_451210 [Microthyrium microscopicum]|uniref:Uncharacterized protein n=1 Tax=Microthyrium microscopicum TaxID=703497 RepID=A0A6A6UN21_9PEZI|nr:hypothetical protein BT63DRAFT_451210 [Microthyrium microscopicum]
MRVYNWISVGLLAQTGYGRPMSRDPHGGQQIDDGCKYTPGSWTVGCANFAGSWNLPSQIQQMPKLYSMAFPVSELEKRQDIDSVQRRILELNAEIEADTAQIASLVLMIAQADAAVAMAMTAQQTIDRQATAARLRTAAQTVTDHRNALREEARVLAEHVDGANEPLPLYNTSGGAPQYTPDVPQYDPNFGPDYGAGPDLTLGGSGMSSG